MYDFLQKTLQTFVCDADVCVLLVLVLMGAAASHPL